MKNRNPVNTTQYTCLSCTNTSSNLFPTHMFARTLHLPAMFNPLLLLTFFFLSAPVRVSPFPTRLSLRMCSFFPSFDCVVSQFVLRLSNFLSLPHLNWPVRLVLSHRKFMPSFFQSQIRAPFTRCNYFRTPYYVIFDIFLLPFNFICYR